MNINYELPDTLRTKLTEAGTPHLVEFFESFCDDAPLWPDVDEAAPFVEAVLDAFLDVLAENDNEWWDLAARHHEDPPMRDNPPGPDSWIEVLRGNR